LNEEEQFYMRSRGISLEDAKVLQMISFVSPVLEHIHDEQLREEVATLIEKEIRTQL
jgi:Fe-S cluster assembly protein SufD